MRYLCRAGSRWTASGAVMIEFVIVLPLLLLLFFGVFEYGRIVQYNNIIVNVGREGANLSARTFGSDYQDIMEKLSMTAEPLDMPENGMVFITQIVGLADGRGQVSGQHYWLHGGYDDESSVWDCDSWRVDGSCIIPDPSDTLSIANIPMTLREGEIVYAVEVSYNYNLIFPQFFQIGPDTRLHSMSVL